MQKARAAAGRLAALLLALALSGPALAQRPEFPAPPRLPLQITVPETLGAGGEDAPLVGARRVGLPSARLYQGRPPVVPPPRPGSASAVVASVEAAPLLRPRARPAGAAAAEAPRAAGQTLLASRPPVVPPRAPRAALAERIAAAVAAAAPEAAAPEVSPLAIAASPRPSARSRAALRRFERAASREQSRAPTLAAASGGSRTAPSGSGGLCGNPALRGRTLDRIRSGTSGCGIERPVSLTHVNGIRLSQAATLHCDAANAFGRWVTNIAQPALANTGGGIAEIQIAAHYACRTRNNQRGARISEHGRGRAIDISGFRLANGDRIVVLNHYNSGGYSRALVRMRQGACGIFRTVLGPGSDRFHADHFHFDSAEHRGGGSYCR